MLLPLESFLLQEIHSRSHPDLDVFMAAVSFFGEGLFFAAFYACVLTLLSVRKRWREIAFFVLVGLTTGAAEAILKNAFQRARPHLWRGLPDIGGYSFPSGHALSSVSIYGGLIYLLARSFPQHKNVLRIVGSAWIFLLGFSRLYLGVHWPSDVLAGWAIGGALLYAAIRCHQRGVEA